MAWLERFATTDGQRRRFAAPGLSGKDFRMIEQGASDVGWAVSATLDVRNIGDAVARDVISSTVAAYVDAMVAQFGRPEEEVE